jgi:hypothetical protein
MTKRDSIGAESLRWEVIVGGEVRSGDGPEAKGESTFDNRPTNWRVMSPTKSRYALFRAQKRGTEQIRAKESNADRRVLGEGPQRIGYFASQANGVGAR